MTKEDLEKRKLELEIMQLRRPWIFKWEFWKVVIPSIAIILSIIITYQSGILDFEKSKLSLEKVELRKEIADFEQQKTDLQLDLEKGDSTKTVLQEEIDYYKFQRQELLKKLKSIGKQVELTDAEKEVMRLDYENRKAQYIQKLKDKVNSEKKQREELKKLQGTIGNQEVRIAALGASKKYLLSKVKLSIIEQSELNIAELEAQDDVHEMHIEALEKRIKELDEGIKKTTERINNMSTQELDSVREMIFLEYELNQ